MLRDRIAVSLLASAVFTCAACAPESPSSSEGADLAAEGQAAGWLRAQFPTRSVEILERERGFTTAAEGFRLDDEGEGGGWRRVQIDLPSEAADVVTLRVTGGFSVRVREVGLEGFGALTGTAVAYRRAGGTSFWTAAAGGVEEWLHLEAGIARGDSPVAVWEVEGATLRQRGPVVEVVDDTGVVQLAVTAPRAYAGGEREIEARLAVVGSRIELFADGGGEAVLVDPAWTAGSPMSSARLAHKSVKLLDGRVFVTGGTAGSGALSSTEMYDPSTNTWTTKAPMTAARQQHTATLLADGRVLVVGGTSTGGTVLSAAEIYNPGTNSWSPAGAMAAGRFSHAESRLSNGKVLVTGGRAGATYYTNADIYDPSTNTWTSAPTMQGARAEHISVRLNDGRVLIAGGYASGYLASAEVYNASTNLWTSASPMMAARGLPSAVVLSNGNVMVAGGHNGSSMSSTEVYNPSSNTWSPGATMNNGHWQFTLVQLTAGRFLAVGNYVLAELFDESSNTWIAAGSMSANRYGHIAHLLDNGSVVEAGGYNVTQLSSVEIFTPQAQGASCSSGGECQTLKCVDGKCCNTSCTGTCVACSAAKKGSGSDGTCGNIGSGLDPDSECSAQAASTCGTTGVCGGAGTCQFHANGTTCVAGSCVGSQAIKPDLCNGFGTCVDAGLQECAPFACSGGVCSASCLGDAQCASGNYCSSPSCLPKKATGLSCSASNQCQSGMCTDGVCCGTACNGTCFACSAAKKGLGPDGACGPIVAGVDPDNECQDQGLASCGTNGVCDGAGTCQKYQAGTTCAAASCIGTTLFNTDACNGGGTCVDGGTQDCTPFACAGAACLASCAADGECAPSAFCTAPLCVSKKADGATCAAANECLTGFCADGVCCDATCDGTCLACTAAKKGSGNDGACGPIGVGTDPDGDCDDEGAASCGDDGWCDGAGACEKFVAATVCVPAGCNGVVFSAADQCDGSGLCVDAGDVDCAPFACAPAGCLTMCVGDPDCAPGHYCDGGACLPHVAQGEPCTAENQCASGFCADSVCCDIACDGACEACSVAKKSGGSDGVCGPVAADTDPDDECDPDDLSTCGNDGKCDGIGACRKHPSGIVCAAAACSGSTWSPSSLCDGQGTCVDAGAQDCSPFGCSPAGCLSTCTDDGQCDPAAYCDGSICVVKKPAGEACEGLSECLGGQCVDGTCCDAGGDCGDGAGEGTKSFYACSAASNVPGRSAAGGLAAVLTCLGLALLRRRRRSESATWNRRIWSAGR